MPVARAGRLFTLVLVVVVTAAPSAAQAAGPTALTSDGGGTVYAGFASGAITRYRALDGAALTRWETPVADAYGSLGGIVAMDVGPSNGGVWVLDANRRIQEFNRSGAFIRGFGVAPCEGGNDPAPGAKGGLEVTATAVYVAHPCADSVERYALSDVPATGIGSPSAVGAFAYAPHGIAAPPSEAVAADIRALYVTQPRSSSVRRFDLTTMAQIGDAIPITHTGNPDDVHLSGGPLEGRVLVSETANPDPGYAHRIYAFGASDSGAFPELFNFGGSGATPGRLSDAVAVDAVGTEGGFSSSVVAADRANERVQRLTSTPEDNGNVEWVAPATDPGPPPQAAGGSGGDGSTTDDRPRDPRVQINGGARYTPAPDVTLTLSEPRGTDWIEIANAADFESSERFPAGKETLDWELEPKKPDKIRRRVFVRFLGSGRPVTTDEIRLDRGRPRIASARLVRGKSGWTLRVVASDDGSGASELRIAASEDGPFQERSFEVRTALENPREARWVRVADLVGNVSKLERAGRRRHK